jgi:hypothetical protein
MATLSNFFKSARYDLNDYGTGLEFDDVELLEYLNRAIVIMDSTLASLENDIVNGTEADIDTVSSQDYVDISGMNNGYFDDVKTVWLGQDRLTQISVNDMYYNRKFKTSDERPYNWAIEGNLILFESGAASAYTDLVIHYYKTTRPRLLTWSDTFTAANATEIFTVSPATTFVRGDGRFQVSNSGGALPTGLTASTDYWMIPITTTTYYLATSESNAIAGTNLSISDDGSGTNTISLTEYTPYNGRFDNLLREAVVMTAKAKKEGVIEQPEIMYKGLFNRRAMEQTIRRNFVPKEYYIDF